MLRQWWFASETPENTSASCWSTPSSGRKIPRSRSAKNSIWVQTHPDMNASLLNDSATIDKELTSIQIIPSQLSPVVGVVSRSRRSCLLSSDDMQRILLRKITRWWKKSSRQTKVKAKSQRKFYIASSEVTLFVSDLRLFNSLFKVLSSFPHLFTIGLLPTFSFRWNLQLQTSKDNFYIL